MAATTVSDNRPVFFFDIDNCLYPRSLQIQEMMADKIDKYFERHLSLSAADATALHTRYYRDYGLALTGLVKYHKVDPLAYNKEVDDALPLEGVIKPDEELQDLLAGVDKDKCKLWLFTNAHVTHARRVVRLLGVEQFFEGLTYCDYTKQPLVAKPHAEMFEKAEREAGVTLPVEERQRRSHRSKGNGAKKADIEEANTVDGENSRLHNPCFFVDDSALNCRAAKERGWISVHKMEEDGPEPKKAPAGNFRVRRLQELKDLFPEFWRKE